MAAPSTSRSRRCCEAVQARAARTIATAESCTGGLLAARLTELAGASDYLSGGIVAYSNEAKVSQAGVPPELIETYGAVSAEVARALADGARAAFGADVGVGVTGVAGPGGGTEQKPVGLVWLSVTLADDEPLTRSVNLPGGRVDVRDRATTVAMHLLRRALSEAPSDASRRVRQMARARHSKAVRGGRPARLHVASSSSSGPAVRRGGAHGRRRARRAAATGRAVAASDAVLPRQPPGGGDRDARQRRSPACAEPACELSVGAPLWLPPRRPHALAVGDPRSRRRARSGMQERVSGALASVSGWQPERRRFRPHITVARVRRAAAGARAAAVGTGLPVGAGSRSGRRTAAGSPGAMLLAATPRLSFAPEALVLYRSWLAPEGASYEALASSELVVVGR